MEVPKLHILVPKHAFLCNSFCDYLIDKVPSSSLLGDSCSRMSSFDLKHAHVWFFPQTVLALRGSYGVAFREGHGRGLGAQMLPASISLHF